MTRVIIIGAGVMGTAFATPLSDRGMKVDLIGSPLDNELVQSMRDTRIHPRLKSRIGESVTPHFADDLPKLLQLPADLVIVGVSTPGTPWIGQIFRQYLKQECPVIFLTKGIAQEPGHIRILPDLVAEELGKAGIKHGPFGAVGGPCIAAELSERRQTSAMIAFADIALAQNWARMISTPYYHLDWSDDLTGVEICAALKNFYAIGVSFATGRLASEPLANGAGLNNETASLFTQAVRELALIVAASGGRSETAFGLAGLGDLHVTTQAGRNSRLGKLFGMGMSYREAMAGPLKGETVEGTLVAQSLGAPLAALERSGKLLQQQLPLAWRVINAVCADLPMRPDLDGMHMGL